VEYGPAGRVAGREARHSARGRQRGFNLGICADGVTQRPGLAGAGCRKKGVSMALLRSIAQGARLQRMKDSYGLSMQESKEWELAQRALRAEDWPALEGYIKEIEAKHRKFGWFERIVVGFLRRRG